MNLRVRRRKPLVLVAVAALITLPGCWWLRPSDDGDRPTQFQPPHAAHVAAGPPGGADAT